MACTLWLAVASPSAPSLVLRLDLETLSAPLPFPMTRAGLGTVANRNVEKKQKTQKILERGEYFGQYEKVLKVSVSWPIGTPSQQASTNHNINMENSFPSLCEREMHRFFHLKNASELRLDNIPVLLNEYGKLLSA
ncbi:hypothetical protein GUJ93_ZPchr0008g12721 [Zizania palustris]|uniref:Uncharacterized protein n=1 Tax=Zizania palustris TaxID=103762 RepID=A0A8J5RYN4_ZIZPA|nr:hypothetical protein GUJ93_ZPchr0008g12721 [Zizania palustris]